MKLFLILIISNFSFSNDFGEPFEFSKDQKKCISSSDKRVLAPQAISSFKDIDPEFLKNHPICQQQVTCSNPNRIQILKERRLLPDVGGVSLGELNIDQKVSRKVCGIRDPISEAKGIDELRSTILEKGRIIPRETYLSQKLILDTKKTVTDYITLSADANAKLTTCFRYNEELEKSGIAFDQRAEFAKKSSSIPMECQRIWRSDSEIPSLIQKNKELRQTLALINLIDKGQFENGNQILDLCIDLKEGGPITPFYKKILNEKINPRKQRFFGEKLPSKFWDGTPDHLEELNEHEKKGLLEVLSSQLKNNSSQLKPNQIKQSLSAHYFQLLNDNPILLEFSSARPNSSELRQAFENNQRKIKALGDFKLKDDVDYLSFSSALNLTIESAPEIERGELCVLANEMIEGRKNFKELPENLALGLMSVESLGAGIAAKGALKKAVGFILGAKYSGTAYQAMMVNKGIEEIKNSSQVCLRVGTDGSGLCRADKIQNANSDVVINSVLLGAFGVPKKQLKMLTPLILSGDQNQQ